MNLTIMLINLIIVGCTSNELVNTKCISRVISCNDSVHNFYDVKKADEDILKSCIDRVKKELK